MGIARQLYNLVADGTTHTNSTTEAVLASATIPAYAMQAGYRIQFVGKVLVPSSNSTDTLTLNVRLGNTTLTGTVVWTSGAVDVANDDVGWVRGEVVFRDSDSASVWHGGAVGCLDAIGTAAVFSAGTATDYDATAAGVIQLTGDWSVAHADNQCAAAVWSVDLIEVGS